MHPTNAAPRIFINASNAGPFHRLSFTSACSSLIRAKFITNLTLPVNAIGPHYGEHVPSFDTLN